MITRIFSSLDNGHPTQRRSRSFLALVGLLLVRQCQRVPLPVLLLVSVEGFWIFFDQHITSQTYHKPPRHFIPPTESSPLSPYYQAPYDEVYDGPTRAFPKPSKIPCGPLMSDTEFQTKGTTNKGLFFLNQRQIASTTLSGVTTRIAKSLAQREEFQDQRTANRTVCTTRLIPIKAKRLKNRVRNQSFAFAFVREPVDRLLSKFYHFGVGLDGRPPSLSEFQRFLEGRVYTEHGSYLKFLTMRRSISAESTAMLPTYTLEVLKQLDFCGVLDRFDESLAVLQLLLGLETRDILYMTTRSGGGDGDGGGGGGGDDGKSPVTAAVAVGDGASYELFQDKCVELPERPNQVPLEWKAYLHRPDLYEDFFEPDVYFYRAANASLDATIDALGRTEVDLAVKRLQWAQQQVQDQCTKNINVQYPCSADGQPQATTDCLFSDVGCGSQCLEAVGEAMLKNPEFQRIG